MAQAIAEAFLMKKSCQATEYLEVLCHFFCRHNQHKQQVYGARINGIEVNALIQGDQRPGDGFAFCYTAMRNGDAVANAGAPQLFPGQKSSVDMIRRQYSSLFRNKLTV